MPVTFSVTQGSATLTPATAITDLNGIATVQVKLGTNTGTVVVTAAANGLPVVGLTYSVVAGVRAPVFAIYPAQVNFQVPALAGAGLPVQVITGCGTPAS